MRHWAESPALQFFEGYEAVFEGVDDCLRAIFQMQFGEQAPDVGFDGFLGDAELGGDFLIRAAEGQLAEDLGFAG